MPKHVYILVTCKTPECSNLCAVACLGRATERIKVESVAPKGFSYTCLNCNRTHRYEASEAVAQLLDGPPPVGWKSDWKR